MINDIKLDQVSFGETPKIRQDAPKAAAPIKTDGITISDHLTQMVDIMTPEDNEMNSAARVKEMKNRIESKNYHVDVDALSTKIVHHLFNGI